MPYSSIKSPAWPMLGSALVVKASKIKSTKTVRFAGFDNQHGVNS